MIRGSNNERKSNPDLVGNATVFGMGHSQRCEKENCGVVQVKGIDISAWQTDIDWQAVKNAGIEFVIVKLGQNYRLDEMFVQHINDATAAGLKTGVYYYTRAQDETQAMSDAGWVAAQIQQYIGQAPEAGIWYDVEDESITDATAICKAFIQQMPYAVGIYANYDWLTNRIDTDALGCPIWCAQYDSQCDFEGAAIWQYTDSLEIAGQKFDGNEYYGEMV